MEHGVNVVELLAPAGEPDAGYAALQYGANAIYLGLHRFSARAEAGNFTLRELGAIVSYAHSLVPRRSVYVALNTLVLDSEVDDVIDLLFRIEECATDALIVQDLGVARIVKRNFPRLRLHASTQMAIHNLDGVMAAADQGFSRVTLARELTFEEVRTIVARSPIQIEVFIHGALCYSYSGLCLYSALLRGRSGNRGRCAYPCRGIFSSNTGSGSGMWFSMKDLAIPELISELQGSGVASLKIEGRKKSPLYVASTVAMYRRLLDGIPFPQLERSGEADDMRTVFSRPWTSLYWKSRRGDKVVDQQFVGHRGTRIGRTLSVIHLKGRDWLKFRTDRRIERHDGLQLEITGDTKPFGFAVEHILTLGKTGQWLHSYEAAPQDQILVMLPVIHPDIPSGSDVFCSSSQAVKQRFRFTRPRPSTHRPRRAVDIQVRISRDAIEMVAVSRNEKGVVASLTEKGQWETARDASQADSAIREAFDRLGNTEYVAGKLTIENDGRYFIPVSIVNRLRRRLTEELDDALAAYRLSSIQKCRERESAPSSETNGAALSWMIKVDRMEYLDAFEVNDWEGVGEVVVSVGLAPAEDLEHRLTQFRSVHPAILVRLSTPVITRTWERDELMRQVARLLSLGFMSWEVSCAGSFHMLNEAGNSAGLSGMVRIAADWPYFVMNRSAINELFANGIEWVTLSPENVMQNATSLLCRYGRHLVLPVYSDPPLFISETCPQSVMGVRCTPACGHKSSELLLGSRGEKVQVIHRGCRTVVLNQLPFCIASRIPALRASGLHTARADFVWRAYTAQVVASVWRKLRGSDKLSGFDPWDMIREVG